MAKFVFLLSFLTSPAFACKLALVLSIDVSNSVDRHEYQYQTNGLADALLDIAVKHVLIRDQVALTVVQWSGPDEQAVILPWQQMFTNQDVLDFAAQARQMNREYLYSKTALGDALAFSISLFGSAPDCTRRVIDVSGDGISNSGINVENQRMSAAAQSIEINAVAVGSQNGHVTEYFREFVITPGGFVLTSSGFQDYPDAIRTKLLRELIKPSS